MDFGRILSVLISIALFLAFLIAEWKIFEKAGKPGWACIIPIYNLIVLLQIVNKPLWWIILFLIPIVNVVALILVTLKLGEAFGKDAVWSIILLLIIPVGHLILGFGDATYSKPAA